MDARTLSRIAIVSVIMLGGCARIARPPAPSTPPAPTTRYEIVQGRNPGLVARLRAEPAPAQAEVSDGHSPQADENLLRERGYVQIGIGHFVERDPARAREQAMRKGRDVGADKVLVYPPGEAGLVATYYVRLHLPFGANFRDLNAQEQQALGSSGVQIGEVVGGTPAAKANLLEGDFVLKFNHRPVQDKPAFQALLEQHMGQRVTLTIRRDGTTLERIVRLGTLPESGRQN
jgi:membrane-associated protease RseP (regulator of RpoE activity)